MEDPLYALFGPSKKSLRRLRDNAHAHSLITSAPVSPITTLPPSITSTAIPTPASVPLSSPQTEEANSQSLGVMEEPAEKATVLDVVQDPAPPTTPSSQTQTQTPHWHPIPPAVAPPTPPPVLKIAPVPSGAESSTTSQPSQPPQDPLSPAPASSNMEPTSLSGERLDKMLMVGISGPPHSPKSALAHLLTFLFHEQVPVVLIAQDKYRVDPSLLVPDVNGGYNRDCPSAYDMVTFIRLLRYVRDTGGLPVRYGYGCGCEGLGDVETQTKEKEKEAVESAGEELIRNLAALLAKSSSLGRVKKGIGIVSGEFLYLDREIRADILDVRMHLRYSKDFVKTKRFEKPGYSKMTTNEDEEKYWWKTSAYFEDTLWPSYEKCYGKLFQQKDVEGLPDQRYCDRYGIQMQPELDAPIKETLIWALEVIADEISERLEGRTSSPLKKVGRTKTILSTVCDSLESIRRTINHYVLPADD